MFVEVAEGRGFEPPVVLYDCELCLSIVTYGEFLLVFVSPGTIRYTPMASLYQRVGSPYFWLKFKDAHGQVLQISTHCRVGVAPEVRRARELCAEKVLAELQGYAGCRKEERWALWVPDFLRAKYGATRTTTLERYLGSWRCLAIFLEEKNIRTPRELRRAHCLSYVAWRKVPDLGKGKYRAGHNTALLDLKILRLIMTEALEREYAVGNPVVSLGLKRARIQLKPAYSLADLEFIRAEIAKLKDADDLEFFSNSFEIGRYQGCRVSETYLNPMTDVDLAARTITFLTKGDRLHETMLHEKLVPLFTKLQAEGRTTTWVRPPTARRQWPSLRWHRFLNRIGLRASLAGACFHSLRVTVATENARAKVPENMVLRYMGHASPTINRVYQRLRSQDLGDCTKAIV